MTDDKEKAQRRVYVLPPELVQRIGEFQKEMGLSSEVEAARRLLDDALKNRDNYKSLADRFVSRLKETPIPSDVAKDVLVGHPLVKSISFGSDRLSFVMQDDVTVLIMHDGRCFVEDENGRNIYTNVDFGKKGGSFNKDLDDEIPF